MTVVNRTWNDSEKAKFDFLQKEAELVYQAIQSNLKLLINSLTVGISFSGASLIEPIVDHSGSSTDVVDFLLNLFKIFPIFGYTILFYALFLINEITYQSGYRKHLEEEIKKCLSLYPNGLRLWESDIFPYKRNDINNFFLLGGYCLFLSLLSFQVWPRDISWFVIGVSTILVIISLFFTLYARETAYSDLLTNTMQPHENPKRFPKKIRWLKLFAWIAVVIILAKCWRFAATYEAPSPSIRIADLITYYRNESHQNDALEEFQNDIMRTAPELLQEDREWIRTWKNSSPGP